MRLSQHIGHSLTPKLAVEALLDEVSTWEKLGDGVEYQIQGDAMTVYVPERKFKEVPEDFREIRAEEVALAAVNSDAFPSGGPWVLQNSSWVAGTFHPESDAVGWNVYFKDTSKMEPDDTD